MFLFVLFLILNKGKGCVIYDLGFEEDLYDKDCMVEVSINDLEDEVEEGNFIEDD